MLFQGSGAIPTPPSVLAEFLDPRTLGGHLQQRRRPPSPRRPQGYLWGNLAAIALAVLVLLVPRLEELANQIAIVTYCIPLVAIGPVLVIVAGRSSPDGASVVLAAMSVFFTTVVGCLLGLRAAPRASIDLVRAYGGSAWTMLRKVQLISALPSLFAALKIAAPAAFLGRDPGRVPGQRRRLHPRPGADRRADPVRRAAAVVPGAGQRRDLRPRLPAGRAGGPAGRRRGPPAPTSRWACDDGDDHRPGRVRPPVAAAPARRPPWWPARSGARCSPIAIAVVVLVALWAVLLAVFDVSAFVGKSPLDVWQYLFADDPAARGPARLAVRGRRPRGQLRRAGHHAGQRRPSASSPGMLVATVIAVGFVLYQPFEFAFMPIAMLLRSVPLVAMAPLLLLIFGQGKLGIAVIAAIVVLFPALVNIVLGLTSATPQALDVIRVNGGSEVTALLKVRDPVRAAAVPGLGPDLGARRDRGQHAGRVAGRVRRHGRGAVAATRAPATTAGSGRSWRCRCWPPSCSTRSATVVEAAVLASWGPNAGLAPR